GSACSGHAALLLIATTFFFWRRCPLRLQRAPAQPSFSRGVLMSTQRTGLTQQLAHWASGALSQPLPTAAVEQVRNGFIDTVAVMIAGRDQPVVQHLREFVSRRGVQPGPAQILWRESGFAVADAALINATAAHALDYDDVALQGHP